MKNDFQCTDCACEPEELVTKRVNDLWLPWVCEDCYRDRHNEDYPEERNDRSSGE